MNILIYGNEQNRLLLSNSIESHISMQFRQLNFICHNAYDDYIGVLDSVPIDIVFVAADGAYGMECVIAAKNSLPDVPIVWFSNDKDFGVQSYRLGTAYFAEMPITENHVYKALERCAI